ncbi:hypothetical protein M426DRAFT_319795 [Hypoxylon sp. CI-4A]|nr:hypothetical protein M426DRAFT_319795 [Hypoxylon sp. CI-4A]
MTRPRLPPTPASSTEIKGQDHSHQLSSLQMSFELPPSAMGPNAKRQPALKASPVSPPNKISYPVQPSETVKSRRRSSATQKEAFALPPPPTRSRRIIQMKPRPQDEPAEQSTPDKAGSTSAGKNAGGAGSKKKQPSATSAAGRKIARKTAHSLIERRRRSKMNEEFAVLKGLIPACTGEMHKLAILQASIEYVRYLEDCVAKLKEQHADDSTPGPAQFKLPPTTDNDEYDLEDREDEEEEGGPEDVEMAGSEAPSPVYAQTPSRSNQSSISPALVAQDARGRQHSYSSASTEYRHYSYGGQSHASPAFGAQGYPQQNMGTASASHSTLTSPALRPQQEVDQEASAALLMLNVDRRGTGNGGSARGMSVKDLLSS